jgi:hypothetical protein
MNTPVPGLAWEKLAPEVQAVTPILACRGCGKTKAAPTEAPDDVFPSEHCGECPPWRCDGCGEMDSAASRCGCWTDLMTMAHADVKALFAADGTFNVSPDGSLSVADSLPS